MKNINKSKEIAKVEKDYNEILYTSYPYAFTRPEYIKAVASLFNIITPKVEQARILELGCSSGENIINFANIHPNSEVLGIDLSNAQIEIGLKTIEELKLKNIKLQHADIMDLDKSYGKFDYIICHGVFSWVPQEVQDKIFKICEELLNKNGVALVSYNTNPGWNMMRTIRDMQLFHSEIFTSTRDKIAQSRLFLKFVNESLSATDSAYAKFLKEEAAIIEKMSDDYIAHEYLEANNRAFYFHEFMKLASKHNLVYLADAHFASMYTGNLPATAAEKLATVPDIVRTEQYMDFINNRRFRTTLLQHKDIPIKRDLNPQVVDNLYLTCSLVMDQKLTTVDLNNLDEQIRYYSDITCKIEILTTASPAIKSILNVFAENIGNPLQPKELLQLAHKKLKDIPLKTLETEFNNIILRLLFTSYIKIFSEKPKSIYIISTKPKITEYARYQLKDITNNKIFVTNQINELIVLQPHEFHVFMNLDGTKTHQELEDIILEKLKTNELVASVGQDKVLEVDKLQVIASTIVANSLEKAKLSYLLIE